jgi:hypothetical protein
MQMICNIFLDMTTRFIFSVASSFMVFNFAVAGSSQELPLDESKTPPQHLTVHHSQTGQKQILDPMARPVVLISTPCLPCQTLVNEVLTHCPEQLGVVSFVGVGSRSALRKAFPKLQASLWMSSKDSSALQIRGTPTLMFQKRKILGITSCPDLLKQTSLFE